MGKTHRPIEAVALGIDAGDEVFLCPERFLTGESNEVWGAITWEESEIRLAGRACERENDAFRFVYLISFLGGIRTCSLAELTADLDPEAAKSVAIIRSGGAPYITHGKEADMVFGAFEGRLAFAGGAPLSSDTLWWDLISDYPDIPLGELSHVYALRLFPPPDGLEVELSVHASDLERV